MGSSLRMNIAMFSKLAKFAQDAPVYQKPGLFKHKHLRRYTGSCLETDMCRRWEKIQIFSYICFNIIWCT